MKKKTATALLLVGTMMPGIAASGTCNGEFGWASKGTTYAMADGEFIFTGEFSGTFFNADEREPTHRATVQCPGLWHVKAESGRSMGTCILRDAAGDKMYFEWSGEGKFPETGGPFRITGGTGKFSGAAGGGTFKGVSVATGEQGNGLGYASWRDCTY